MLCLFSVDVSEYSNAPSVSHGSWFYLEPFLSFWLKLIVMSAHGGCRHLTISVHFAFKKKKYIRLEYQSLIVINAYVFKSSRVSSPPLHIETYPYHGEPLITWGFIYSAPTAGWTTNALTNRSARCYRQRRKKKIPTVAMIQQQRKRQRSS